MRSTKAALNDRPNGIGGFHRTETYCKIWPYVGLIPNEIFEEVHYHYNKTWLLEVSLQNINAWTDFAERLNLQSRQQATYITISSGLELLGSVQKTYGSWSKALRAL